MKVILTAAATAILLQTTVGFLVPYHRAAPSNTRYQNKVDVASTCLFMNEEVGETNKAPLTSKDILARARKAAGLPVEDEEPDAPKMFDDGLLVDMQESLLMLEKRVKEGRGTLSLLEVDQFEAATKRILAEMQEKLAQDS